MSHALTKAGIITAERAEQAAGSLSLFGTYAKQIQEITLLTELLQKAGIQMNLLDIGSSLVFEARLSRGEYEEAYNGLLSDLRKKAKENKLT